MADHDPEPDQSKNPPPYTPTAPPVPSEQPPPYSPPSGPKDGDKKYSEVQAGGTTPYGTYGTDGMKNMEQYPPGSPPIIDTGITPTTASTTLLISRERKPPTFLFLSFMTCLCFSPLFGILAIIFSCMSDSAWHAGDYDTAKRYSQVALSLSIIGIAISVIVVILIFLTGLVRV